MKISTCLRAVVALLAILLSTGFDSFAQKKKGWDDLKVLLGNWKGEAKSNEGAGACNLSFKMAKNQAAINFQSHYELAQNGSPFGLTRDGMMVIVKNANGKPLKAVYDDMSDHMTTYTLTFEGSSYVFTSELKPYTPVAKITFTIGADKALTVKYANSQDRSTYTTTVEQVVKKVK